MTDAEVKELFESEEFKKGLSETKTAEDVQRLFAANGLEVSLEEIEEIKKAIKSYRDGELSEDDLENVAGGFIFTFGTAAVALLVSFVAGGVGGYLLVTT